MTSSNVLRPGFATFLRISITQLSLEISCVTDAIRAFDKDCEDAISDASTKDEALAIAESLHEKLSSRISDLKHRVHDFTEEIEKYGFDSSAIRAFGHALKRQDKELLLTRNATALDSLDIIKTEIDSLLKPRSKETKATWFGLEKLAKESIQRNDASYAFHNSLFATAREWVNVCNHFDCDCTLINSVHLFIGRYYSAANKWNDIRLEWPKSKAVSIEHCFARSYAQAALDFFLDIINNVVDAAIDSLVIAQDVEVNRLLAKRLAFALSKYADGIGVSVKVTSAIKIQHRIEIEVSREKEKLSRKKDAGKKRSSSDSADSSKNGDTSKVLRDNEIEALPKSQNKKGWIKAKDPAMQSVYGYDTGYLRRRRSAGNKNKKCDGGIDPAGQHWRTDPNNKNVIWYCTKRLIPKRGHKPKKT